MIDSSLSYGQNSWLIEEMYEKFQKDPSNLDKNWFDFFTENKKYFTDSFLQPSGSHSASTTGQGKSARSARSSSSPQNTTPAATSHDGNHPAVTSAAVARNDKPTISPSSRSASAFSSRVFRKGEHSDVHLAHRVPPLSDIPEWNPQSAALQSEAADLALTMEKSLSIPDSTATRAVPAKLLEENQLLINQYLERTHGGQITITDFIAYAFIQALKKYPELNKHFGVLDDKPALVAPPHINLGITERADNQQGFVSLTITQAQELSMAQFLQAMKDESSKLAEAKLSSPVLTEENSPTVILNNFGEEGSEQSTLRVLPGLGAILSLGRLEYPAEYSGASDETIAAMGVGKLLHLSLIFDQRVVNGSEAGALLNTINSMLISDNFYDHIFQSIGVPFAPFRWKTDISNVDIDKNARVLQIIEAYRSRGHLIAQTDPLKISGSSWNPPPDLDQRSFELTIWDLDREFQVGGFHGKQKMKLRDVLKALSDAYCRHVGIEYTHILDHSQRQWLQERLEEPQTKLSNPLQKYILNRLNAAEAFETFLQTKYVGQKRFSLEGSETIVPMMDAVLDRCCQHHLEEVIIGMPHRGRLNVLANIVGKPYSKIFTEFEGNLDPRFAHGSGDVKYHLGAEGKYYQMFGEEEIKVSLTANPSHLEAVDPVLIGIARAKTDANGKPGSVLPLMLHGDAAFAGQGIVAETLQMADLAGYSAGGTIHIVVNNQIGFTAAPKDSRSSEYCTDVAKMTGAPIFHVNGDDPEACVKMAWLAVDYREKFHKDVVIDLVCYRRRGHNEGDDPSMTQPLMYDVIDTMRSVRKSYTEDLIGRGDITTKEAEDALKDYQSQLERVFNQVRELEKYKPQPSPSVEKDQPLVPKVQTRISQERLEQIGDAFINHPENFTTHPRVVPVAKRRHEMSRHGKIDWAFAELLAFGSLIQEGRRVRLSGEDSRRGTFSQRHCVLIDRKNGNEYYPLRNLAPLSEDTELGAFEAYDSLLSEYGVMGFEYGYSVANPDSLVLWEAQFGDFAPGAQSIIDEFISSGEAKWGQRANVVLLLPHGQEGQGPDHSSGRIERYLQLCAEGSMTVAQPTTPASYFHLLRRHALDGMIRPLVVFTPKSMLRNKAAVSEIDDFTKGKFRSVFEEPSFLFEGADRSKVRRILLVAGKLYYELLDYKQKHDRQDIALVRLEQYYPVPYRRLAATLGLYPHADEIFWVQEEPANQGAWPFLALALPELVQDERIHSLHRVSRRAMSAPASGSVKTHAVEQQQLIEEAFAPRKK